MSYPAGFTFFTKGTDDYLAYRDSVQANGARTYKNGAHLNQLIASEQKSIDGEAGYQKAVIGSGYLTFYDAQSNLLCKVSASLQQETMSYDSGHADAVVGFEDYARFVGREFLPEDRRSEFGFQDRRGVTLTKPKIYLNVALHADASGTLVDGDGNESILFHSTVTKTGTVASCYFTQLTGTNGDPLAGAPTLEQLATQTPEQLDGAATGNEHAWVKLSVDGGSPVVTLSSLDVQKLARLIVQDEIRFDIDALDGAAVTQAVSGFKSRLDAIGTAYTALPI